jgi:DNA-binding transcriptional ArsR family regulator
LESDEAWPDFDATKAELFEAISHPIRIRILRTLSEKPMGFAELGRAIGIESGGHLSFHLTKLRHLVKMTREGNYALTGDGKEALWSVNALQKSSDKITRQAGSRVRSRSLSTKASV